MVFVPAGEFLMGSSSEVIQEVMKSFEGWSSEWFVSETPQHQVYLEAYWIDKYEITNQQFARFIADGGYKRRELWTSEGWEWRNRENRSYPAYWTDERWNAPELPVVGVVWFEAVAYCRWAGARLPTEAEWERAAGWDFENRVHLVYPWGNVWNSVNANTKEASIGHTTPVGAFCPEGASPVGACDMAGNVWEWCSSLYKLYPYNAGDGREDLEAKGTRVLRGGSWLNAAIEARTSFRLPPFSGDFILFDPTSGFRCAMSMESTPHNDGR
jgi:formylglycine-generating enzyme required for sulfatase activity